MIYPFTLYIAKAKDGRNILYDINVKISEGVAIAQNTTSGKNRTENKVATSSDGGIISNSEKSNPEKGPQGSGHREDGQDQGTAGTPEGERFHGGANSSVPGAYAPGPLFR